MNRRLPLSTLVFLFLIPVGPTIGQQVLPSWKEGSSRQAIVSFVQKVTDEASSDFVPPVDRVAVFDNDGTLWAEKPVYFQLLFALDRIRELAADHPEWETTEPFAAVLKNDVASVMAQGEDALKQILVASHTGMSSEEFDSIVNDWVATARHPTTGRPYTEMVYQPMLELLDFLRKNEFRTFIVSGGGIDFMRPWAHSVYGIPREQVVGSSVKTQYEIRDGKPIILRLPEVGFIDDKAGKPVGIQQHIGRRPLMAFGNSDGDFQMLEWTTSGTGPRLGVIIHHTDAQREWAYDRDSSVGKLVRGLAEAEERGWVLVDMEAEWTTVFPPASESN